MATLTGAMTDCSHPGWITTDGEPVRCDKCGVRLVDVRRAEELLENMGKKPQRTLGQVGYETMASLNNWRSAKNQPLAPWCPGAEGSDSIVMAPIPVALSETEAGRELQRKWELVGDAITNELRNPKM